MSATKKPRTLYHVHDPMCSWCYAFRPVWNEVSQNLPQDIELKYVLGGLAPDSDAPMPKEMQNMLIGTWQRIMQTVPGTTFNFDFWQNNQPRRSTYPACRALIATRKQNPAKERSVLQSIQNAYYQQALNPSDDSTLIQVVVENDLNTTQFAADLHADSTREALLDEIRFARSIGGDSFPSLIMREGEQLRLIMLSYTDAGHILQQL
ncbi:MAG: DsbA family protein [Thiolinea sp.]